MAKSLLFICVFNIVLILNNIFAAVLVYESFDDLEFSEPLNIFNEDSSGNGYSYNLKFVTGIGDSGYSIKGDHSQSGYSVLAILDNLNTTLDDGIYIRYWVKYSTNYSFPWEHGLYSNIKIIKFSTPQSEGNIEIAWESFNTVKTQWEDENSEIVGLDYWDLSGRILDKGSWHKIEIYIRIPDGGSANSTFRMQVNDSNVINESGLNIYKPASQYTGAKQFCSVRATNTPPSGQGEWYIDSITIVHAEGDLCDNEPPEPTGKWVPPPRKPSGFKVTR